MELLTPLCTPRKEEAEGKAMDEPAAKLGAFFLLLTPNITHGAEATSGRTETWDAMRTCGSGKLLQVRLLPGLRGKQRVLPLLLRDSNFHQP